MSKMARIDVCGDCPFCDSIYTYNKRECALLDYKKLEDYHEKIDPECPLPDYEEAWNE